MKNRTKVSIFMSFVMAISGLSVTANAQSAQNSDKAAQSESLSSHNSSESVYVKSQEDDSVFDLLANLTHLCKNESRVESLIQNIGALKIDNTIENTNAKVIEVSDVIVFKNNSSIDSSNQVF